MEIAKDHAPNNSTMCLIQPHQYFDSDFCPPSGHGFDHDQHKRAFEEEGSSEKSSGVVKNVAVSSSSSLSSPRSANSEGLGYPAVTFGTEEGHSVINFKAGYGNFAQAGGSLLSFDQNERFSQNSFSRMINNQDDYSIWEDNLHYSYQNQLNSRCSATNPQLLENSNNIKTANSYASTSSEVTLGWICSEQNANAAMNNIPVPGRPETCLNKRPYLGESTQALKKQCTTTITKTLKSKSKDPQSIAAKNRRERISERLKILQDLVPNGSKVDLVTMLEKAISYVKFLQLQVKVLATDEFWPAQGGKAPDLSQVREAIDTILASQRDRNSSSK